MLKAINDEKLNSLPYKETIEAMQLERTQKKNFALTIHSLAVACMHNIFFSTTFTIQ